MRIAREIAGELNRIYDTQLTNDLVETLNECDGRGSPCDESVGWYCEKHANERAQYLNKHPEYGAIEDRAEFKAYNQAIEDAKKAIGNEGAPEWEGSEFKPYFITAIARACSPHVYVNRLNDYQLRKEER